MEYVSSITNTWLRVSLSPTDEGLAIFCHEYREPQHRQNAFHCDANQQIEYLICAGRDITERKQVEEERRWLVDAILRFIWMARPDGSITYNNQRLIDYLAMLHEQTEGNDWMAAVHPDDLQHVREVWQTLVQRGVPYEVEQRVQDGTSGA